MKPTINIKEANERIANMEAEPAKLKELVANAKTRAPRQIPYSVDELAKRIKDNGLNEDLVVGDYIDITLYTGEEVKAYIVGIQHDEMDGGGVADYTFAIPFVDYEFKMNDTNTNKTSWEKSKMRNTYIPRIYALLPAALRENIVPVKKLTSAGGESSKILTTVDKLFLFSEMEIYGVHRLSFDGEGKQYEFFKEEENFEISNYPWLRSPCYGSSSSFCYVISSGYGSYFNAGFSFGVAFGFCLTSKNR